MASPKQTRAELSDLLGRRPGWRLEPRTTPGATPLWCFVAGAQVVLSVSSDEGSIRVYVMATDQEVECADAGELTAWLRSNRVDALQEVPPRKGRSSRFKSLFEWG